MSPGSPVRVLGAPGPAPCSHISQLHPSYQSPTQAELAWDTALALLSG